MFFSIYEVIITVMCFISENKMRFGISVMFSCKIFLLSLIGLEKI